MNVNIYHKHKDIIITTFIIASRAYLQHRTPLLCRCDVSLAACRGAASAPSSSTVNASRDRQRQRPLEPQVLRHGTRKTPARNPSSTPANQDGTTRPTPQEETSTMPSSANDKTDTSREPGNYAIPRRRNRKPNLDTPSS